MKQQNIVKLPCALWKQKSTAVMRDPVQPRLMSTPSTVMQHKLRCKRHNGSEQMKAQWQQENKCAGLPRICTEAAGTGCASLWAPLG
eukprot:1147546-Pelagomonas_calceolata.AAC.1